jgi:hypothetical protein
LLPHASHARGSDDDRLFFDNLQKNELRKEDRLEIVANVGGESGHALAVVDRVADDRIDVSLPSEHRRQATMWANFVKTGDPNGEGLPVWPRVSRSNGGSYMVFGEKSTRATNESPYVGTSSEPRNALMHDFQMKDYAVSW